VRWTEDLTDLVAACEAASLLASGPVSPAPTHGSGPTEAEFATLDAERDLLAADLAALKEELTTVSFSSFSPRSRHADSLYEPFLSLWTKTSHYVRIS
jgi:hypothetical protein